MNLVRAACIVFCLASAVPFALADTAGSAERGAAVAAQWCAECHAVGTSSRASDVGPAFTEIARTRSDEYIRGFLANPHVRGRMPPFDLTTQHIEELVAHLRTLR